MRYEIKRVEIWPIVKIVLIVSLLFGFFMGLINAAFFLLVDAITQTVNSIGFDNVQTFDGSFIVFILIMSTLSVAFLSTFAAVVVTVIYNILSGWLGGLVVDLEAVNESDQEISTVG